MADAKEGGASKEDKDKEKKEEEVVEPALKKTKRGRPSRRVEGAVSANANAKAPALFCVGDRVLLKSYIGEGDDENLDGYFIATITELTQKESGVVLYCLRKVDGSVLEEVVEELITKSVQM
jgi:hypothetical protein